MYIITKTNYYNQTRLLREILRSTPRRDNPFFLQTIFYQLSGETILVTLEIKFYFKYYSKKTWCETAKKNPNTHWWLMTPLINSVDVKSQKVFIQRRFLTNTFWTFMANFLWMISREKLQVTVFYYNLLHFICINTIQH